MSEEILRARVEVEVPYDEIEDAQATVEQLQTFWETLKMKVKEETRLILRGFNNMISVFRSVLRMLGVTLDPVQEAILLMITTVVQTMMQAAAAMAAAPGAGIPISALLAIAAGAFSIIATTGALAGMEQAKQSFQNASSVIDSLYGLSRSMSMGGFY